ncbi:MAG: hypothetical protein HFG81_01105 [Dorea sp.]|jgi:hypothetical protein|uniref:hypothetical protein n=1 Tax=Sporofaciens musculi TaxID=2681861 RepID=UPI0021715007|nr:hypothetical protein [Sporofaciens musculi]MCI9421301.1 hypothetical protein [Dorea sp.]
MVKNVKPGYVNPLEMIKKGGQTNRLGLGGMKTAEKKRKSLETEKQSLQNSLLLMKGTSGDAGASEESIEVLEKKLEEITKELQSGRRVMAEEWMTNDTQTEEGEMSALRCNFDRFMKSESEESAGCYELWKDDEKGYRIAYKAFENE